MNVAVGWRRLDSAEDWLRAANLAGMDQAPQSRAGVRDGRTAAEAQRFKELERELKELRRANEILKRASAFFVQAQLDRRLR